MTRNRTRGAVAIAFGALLVGLAMRQFLVGGGLPADGPYPRTDPAGVDFELVPGASATWGLGLPGSTRGPVVLQAIEPLGVEGIDVLGVAVCHWSGVPDAEGIYNDCAPIASRTWPPAGATLVDVAGTVVEPGNRPFVSAVIGVRRQPTAVESRIAAIRIVYVADGTTYEVVEPWSLGLVDPGSTSASD